MDSGDSVSLSERVKSCLLEGPESEKSRNYNQLMKDPNGVIDSILVTYDDTYGTVQHRRPHVLYNKYKSKIHKTEPKLDQRSYGQALAALEDMGIVQRDKEKANVLWNFGETEPNQLKAVKRAAADRDVQRLYR
jgi:hypothetical protein